MPGASTATELADVAAIPSVNSTKMPSIGAFLPSVAQMAKLTSPSVNWSFSLASKWIEFEAAR